MAGNVSKISVLLVQAVGDSTEPVGSLWKDERLSPVSRQESDGLISNLHWNDGSNLCLYERFGSDWWKELSLVRKKFRLGMRSQHENRHCGSLCDAA